MTKKKLTEMYRAFFKAEGIKSEWDSLFSMHGKVIYDGLNYRVIYDQKLNPGGKCLHMFIWGPDFICWENPELEYKVKFATKKVNALHDLAKVNADCEEITYSIEIKLQSPEQFKDFFYIAARELKAIENDFVNELKKR